MYTVDSETFYVKVNLRISLLIQVVSVNDNTLYLVWNTGKLGGFDFADDLALVVNAFTASIQ